MEITNFLLLTVLVLSPILALLLSDVSLGPNSPVGLVMKHSIENSGQIISNNIGKPQQGGQWVLNIGGSQRDNYLNGIQIPIFVIVFGIIGGYLRFLYDRATVNSARITNEFEHIEIVIKKRQGFYNDNYQNLRLPISYSIKKRIIGVLTKKII